MTDALTLPAEFAPQGSPEWLAARRGRFTASRFKDLVTAGTGQAKQNRAKTGPSDTAQKYIRQVAGEILTSTTAESYEGKAMWWGSEWEEDARICYGDLNNVAVEEVGFVQHEHEPRVGSSPDGLVGDPGTIEIKCPHTTAQHLLHLLDGVPTEHLPQIQGNLWVLNRYWCDFVSYDSRITFPNSLPVALVVIRVERDDEYIENLEAAVFGAVRSLNEILARCLRVDVEEIPETLERLGLTL